MTKSETTKVDTEGTKIIKVCSAIVEPGSNHLIPVEKARIDVKEHLNNNPVITINAENNEPKTVAKKAEKTAEEGR